MAKTDILDFDPLAQAEIVMSGLANESRAGVLIIDLDARRQDMRDLTLMSIAQSLRTIAEAIGPTGRPLEGPNDQADIASEPVNRGTDGNPPRHIDLMAALRNAVQANESDIP